MSNKVPSNFPFLIKNSNATNMTPSPTPGIPGAYIINTGGGSHPIFCSMANLDNIGMANVDNYFLVMPGFYLTVWPDINYASTQAAYITYCDNSKNNNIGFYKSNLTDTASSCKLYYNVNGTLTEITIYGLS
jgi:hypothetical protein